MGRPNVNVVVGGPLNSTGGPCTYKTVILKNGIPFAQQVTEPNTKYIIKWDFNLKGNDGKYYDVDFTDADTHSIGGVTYYYIPLTANGETYMLLDENLVFIDAEWNGLSTRKLKPAEGTPFMIGSTTGGLHRKGYLNGNPVILPENCILDFDGGSVYNGILIGHVDNDYLDVSNFTKDEYIDEALQNVLNICDVAHIPSGTSKLHDIFYIHNPHTAVDKQRKLKIEGVGHGSIIHTDSQSYLYIDDCAYLTIQNLAFNVAIENENPAIRVEGLRYGLLKNLLIRSDVRVNEGNKATGILVKREPSLTMFNCAVLSTFENIQIEDMKYGIILDAYTNQDAAIDPRTGNPVRNHRDYVTSCNFNDILISRMTDTAMLIKGAMVYYNSFNNIHIQDAYAGVIDHKGIVFDGGYSNDYTNVITWADARVKKETDQMEFYALYFISNGNVKMPNHITGSLEGMLGCASGAYQDYLAQYLYDFDIHMVSSIDNVQAYVGRMTNLQSAKNVSVLLDLKQGLNSYIEHIGSNVQIEYLGSSVKVSGDLNENNQMGITMFPSYPYNLSKIAGVSNIKAVFVGELDRNHYLYVRIVANGSTYEYLQMHGRFSNTVVWTESTKNVDSDLGGFYVQVYSNATEFYLKDLYLITIPEQFNINVLKGNIGILEQASKKGLYHPILNAYSQIPDTYKPENGQAIYDLAEKRPFWYRDGWLDSKGYSHAKIKGTTAQRPLAQHEEEEEIVGDLKPSDLGFEYFDTDLRKPLWVKTLNNTTGVVTWVEADGSFAGINRSGTWNQRPDNAAKIYTGFVYIVEKSATNKFPVYAIVEDSTITWWKADGTQYTGG